MKKEKLFGFQIQSEGKRLLKVIFPKNIPKDFDKTKLRKLQNHIGKFHIDFQDSPPFYQKVYKNLLKVSPGRVTTYKDLANKCKSPRAARAVGGACRSNPIPIAVPCHRVLASSGFGGFSGGLHWKRKLLELEK